MMECDFHQQSSQNNHHQNEDDEEDQFQGEHQGVRCQTQ